MATPKKQTLFGEVDSPPPSIERDIFFYEIEAGVGQDGPIVIDPTAALEHIDKLPFTVDHGRYLLADNKHGYLCAVPISTTPPQKVIYYVSRRRNLPEVEQGGNFEPLRIPKNSGLGEKCHLMFFGRYVAADFNFHGPHVSTFPTYLHLKAKGLVPGFRFAQLIRGEAAEELESMKGLVYARLKLGRTALGLLADADRSFADAVRATLDSSNADEIEIVLRKRPPKKRNPIQYLNLLKMFKKLSDQGSTYREFEKLQTRGIETVSAERSDLIDILDDRLIISKAMIRSDDRSRGIDSKHAFQQIAKAFREIKPRIQTGRKVY
jgi:hypothetical protein